MQSHSEMWVRGEDKCITINIISEHPIRLHYQHLNDVFVFSHRDLQKEYEHVFAEESRLRRELVEVERTVTVVKHDLQGAQRKLEYETEQRQKVEVKQRETEEALRVQVAQNNRPQVSDKFEKQVGVVRVKSPHLCMGRGSQSVRVLGL